MTRAVSTAVSAQLRQRLGVTPIADADALIASAAEMRALRASLRLTKGQMAAWLGIHPATVLAGERDGMTARRFQRKPAAREKLRQALVVAREMGALRFDPHSRRTARSEHPPADLAYRCAGCGKDLVAAQVTLRDGELTHGRPACGPVQPGGAVHEARGRARMRAAGGVG